MTVIELQLLCGTGPAGIQRQILDSQNDLNGTTIVSLWLSMGVTIVITLTGPRKQNSAALLCCSAFLGKDYDS